MKVIHYILGMLVLIGIKPVPVMAGNYIKNLNIEINLQDNGRSSVVQDIHYAVSGPLDWSILSKHQNLVVTVDGFEQKCQADSSARITHLTCQGPATNYQITYIAKDNLIRQNDIDRYFMKIFNQPNINIGNIDIKLKLPRPTNGSSLTGNAYALNGVSGVTTKVVDNQLINYSASGSSPNGLMTISGAWSKNVLSFDRKNEMRLSLLNMDMIPWLIIGFTLPLVTLIIFIYYVVRNDSENPKTDLIKNKPPTDISPLLAGVIVNKKIYPEEIAALVIDLCRRDYFVIVRKTGEFKLAIKRPIDNHLQDWEKNIIKQLFGEKKEISLPEVAKDSHSILYSQSIYLAFNQIYEAVTELGIFGENPHITRMKYKLIASFLYILSVITIIIAMFLDLNTYLIIPMIGTMVLSTLLIRLTPKLINYTQRGEIYCLELLSYANYLRSSQTLPLKESQSGAFEQGLPYAVAFRVQREWGNRFRRSTVVRPQWYLSYADRTNDQLIEELINFVKSFSAILSNLKGPKVN